MTINQFIGNLTLLILTLILFIILAKVLTTHKRSIETFVDGATLIGVSGWIIQIMSYKVDQASLPTLIFLIVILVQIIRCNADITQLKGKKYEFQIQSKKPRNS